jgi:hypothetical protein
MGSHTVASRRPPTLKRSQQTEGLIVLKRFSVFQYPDTKKNPNTPILWKP